MTIKQQGGVFGRNPTFNDVTVESDLVSKTLTVDGGTLFVDAVNNRVGVNETSPDTKLHLKGSGGTETSIKIENTGAGADGPWLLSAGQPGVGNTGFSIYDVANARSSFHVNSAGDARVTAGNLVIGTSGKGIDFSATAGTGTSELFDDYEEGTWTPAWTNLTVGDGTSTGRYTKFGRTVFVEVDLLLGSTTVVGSSPEINNIPFASADGFLTYGGGGYSDAGTNTHQGSCLVANNSNRLVPFRYNNSGAITYQSTLSATQPFTWAVNDRIRLSVTYTAAG